MGDEEQPPKQSGSSFKTQSHRSLFINCRPLRGSFLWLLYDLNFNSFIFGRRTNHQMNHGFRIVNIIFNLGQQSSKLPFLDHFVLEALSLLLRTLQLHKVMRVESVTFCNPCILQKLRSCKVSHPIPYFHE